MLSCQKDLFVLDERGHYLNCAYLGPLLRSVEAAGLAGIRGRIDPASITAADFFTDASEVRRLFARLVQVSDAERIAILPAVSYGMAIVARNTRVEAGQNLVIAAEQFPSNVYPWRRLASDLGATVRVVAPPPGVEGRGEEWNDRLVEAVDQDTALVALGNVHWADGTRFDLEAIGEKARRAGAALIVDGTQSVGAMPFDVQRLRPDALICAGYKWLLGPYGMALGYFGPRFDGGVPLEENWINRAGSEDFSALVSYRDEYQPGALRYDVGERSNPILLPMLASALRQILEWGPGEITRYCRALSAPAIAELRALGYAVEDERWRGAHLFGVRCPPEIDLGRVQAALARRRVSVSVRGSSIRVAPNVYNQAADLDALISALAAARTGEHAVRR